VITWQDRERRRSHLEVAEAALLGGARVIQLRGKELGGKELYRLALGIKEMIIARGQEALFIVNDRVDVALAAGADGVHLGQEDLPPEIARKLVGEEVIIGVSAGSIEEAVKAEAAGADYLGVGPIFPTPSKQDAGLPIGIDGLVKIRDAVSIPIVAIGGINEVNMEEVLKAGVEGVAVISAVAGAEDMTTAARRLAQIIDLHIQGGK
jgi:thiamine-phosphate pyrophosphorylase